MILVIDYGVGNIQSVANALEFLGYAFCVSRDPAAIATADAYVLPGVGAFAEGMRNLERFDLIDPLTTQVIHARKPFLGICLGMQLLAEASTEKGAHKGLGWIPGRVERIEPSAGVRIPHVGWNTLTLHQRAPLFRRNEPHHRFYFDHSYHFVGAPSDIAATTSHGTEIVAAVQRGNVAGVQFHPEKSQIAGMKLFRDFFDAAGITTSHVVVW